MFERYSEHARRVIFFARYEAGDSRSKFIEPEHVLLGLLREDKHLKSRLPAQTLQRIRTECRARVPAEATTSVSPSVDMPLSLQSKKLLAMAAEESNALQHRLIDSGHLVLALLRAEDSAPAEMLRRNRISYAQYREFFRAGEGPDFQEREGKFQEERERPTALTAAAAALLPHALRLEGLVDRAAERLDAEPEIDGELRLKRLQWTRQEALAIWWIGLTVIRNGLLGHS